jgi:putative ABC transport system permease protein
MNFWSRMRGWLRALTRRSRVEREMDAEMRFHVEAYAEDLVRDGVPPAEAIRRARLEFGGIENTKEECRDVLVLGWLNHIRRDIRFGLHMLIKNPGFTAAAVIALALGIGADTAMYTIVNGALSWDLGLDRRDRIVWVRSTDTRSGEGWDVSYPDFRDFRAQMKTLSGLAAYELLPINLSDKSALPERFYCARMSANGFSVVGQKPLLGRDFIAADEQPGAPPVLMLGYHVWRDRYGQDPGIIGKTVRVDEIPRMVIGVMPPGRRFPEDTDLWTPLVPDAASQKRDTRELTVFGKLRDGVGVAQARTEVATLAGRLAAQYQSTNKEVTADVRPIMEITGVYFMKPVFLALFVAVGFVLLIACADVANMLLARAAERTREISIRVAIGAGRIPILRQLLLESVVLSMVGGFLGVLVAVGGLRWFDRGIGTQTKPLWLHLSLDRNALFYLALISIGTGILFGLAPALRLLKTDVSAALKDGASGVTGSGFGTRVSKALVSFQTALCVVLLTGAGLMIRSAVNLYSTPLGVNAARVLTMRINLPEAKYANPASLTAFHKDLEKRLEGLAGVETAGAASQLPLGSWIPLGVEFEGTTGDAAERPDVGGVVVSNNYFQLMQVRPQRGRLFLDSDGEAGPPAAVVNESFAKKFWPGANPLAKRVRVVEDQSVGRWLMIVGVVPDILQNFRETLKRDPVM